MTRTLSVGQAFLQFVALLCWAIPGASGSDSTPALPSDSIFGGDESVPEAYSLAHLPELGLRGKAVVEVKVQLLDGSGKPAQGRFFCYNQDLGLCYPAVGVSKEIPRGSLLAHLPRGRYTMIAWSPDFFLTRKVTIESSCSVTLSVDSMIRVRAWDFAGRPMPNAEIAVLDSRMKPLLPWFLLAGKSFQDGPVTIGICGESLIDLAIIGRPAVGYSRAESYLIIHQGVGRGDNIVARPRRSDLAHVNFDILDSQHEHCSSAVLEVKFPRLSVAGGTGFFRDKLVRWDELNLWLTPGPALLGIASLPEGDGYNFHPKVVGLRAGRSYRIRAGGTVKPAVWFMPTGDPRHIWVLVHDEFDGGITSMSRRNQADLPTLRLSDDTGNLVHAEQLYGTFDKILESDPTGKDYELTLNLGPFGNHQLRGKSHTSENQFPFTTRQTEHFVVEFPDMFSDRFATFARFAESGYGTISEIVRSEPPSRPRYTLSLFGPGWCSGLAFGCHANYFMDPRALSFYPDDYFKGAMFHELAHVFQGTSKGVENFGTQNGQFAEAMASHFGNLATEQIIGPGPTRYVVAAHRENFFRTFYQTQGCLEELGVETAPDRLQPYWRYYFVLSHLTDVFGRSVHGSFIHLYAKPASQGIWKPLVDREQLTSDELLCGLYSRACNHNLCGLFRLAGFEVAQSKVQGLKDALASAPRP